MREYGWTQQRADSMLALVAMAWGSSYLLMKIGLDGIPPFCIIALRFGIAFIAVSLLFFKKFKKTTKRVMMKGAVLGLFLFGLFAFLMHGLQTTSASNGGFLTSLHRKRTECSLAFGSLDLQRCMVSFVHLCLKHRHCRQAVSSGLQFWAWHLYAAPLDS